MNFWEVTIQLRSGLGTPLANHTIWGHVCWGIRYHEGEEALISWLNACDNGEPPLVISDALPIKTGEPDTPDTFFMPRPQLPQPLRPLEDPGNEAAKDDKLCKKVQWITEDAWKSLVSSLSCDSLRAALIPELAPSLQKATTMHTSINRMTGTTEGEDSSGALFDQEQWYSESNQGKYRLIVCGDDQTRISQLMEWAFEGGYGRDASSGLGAFEIVSVEPLRLPEICGSNCAMLLGSAVPSSKDPHHGFFSWGLHAGRVGGSYANSDLPNGSAQRAKRPVHMLQRGTILKTNSSLNWIGRSVSGVHEYEPIRHGGFAPCVPCKLDDETLQLMGGAT